MFFNLSTITTCQKIYTQNSAIQWKQWPVFNFGLNCTIMIKKNFTVEYTFAFPNPFQVWLVLVLFWILTIIWIMTKDYSILCVIVFLWIWYVVIPFETSSLDFYESVGLELMEKFSLFYHRNQLKKISNHF